MPRYAIRIAVMAGLLGAAAAAGAADQEEIDTLDGLSGVFVTVDNLNPAAEAYGLASRKVQGDVALRLQQNGIHVFTVEQMRHTPGLPILKVSTNVHKSEAGYYVYSIDLYLQQTVKLSRRPSVETYAVTWKTGTLGVVSGDRLSSLKDIVQDNVDEFIRDYKSANPSGST